MKQKPKVGQVLYSLNVGNAARGCKQKLTQVEVTRVGRKYFYIGKGWRETQFRIDNWGENTEYSATQKLYEKPEDWEEEKAQSFLFSALRAEFDSWNSTKFSADQLRRAAEALGIEPEINE